MAEQVEVRAIDDGEGRRLVRIVRRCSGSVVTWRRAQMVLLSAQKMPVARIAEVTFTSADRGAAYRAAPHPGQAGYSSTDIAVFNSPNTSRAYSTRVRGSAADVHRSNAL